MEVPRSDRYIGTWHEICMSREEVVVRSVLVSNGLPHSLTYIRLVVNVDVLSAFRYSYCPKSELGSIVLVHAAMRVFIFSTSTVQHSDALFCYNVECHTYSNRSSDAATFEMQP